MGRILTNLSFFSGVGGLDLGAKACGIATISYCEFDRYAQGVLRSRIADGGLDDGPIWDDVNSFDGKPWKGADIISGGFPCQDVSIAGKRKGIEEGTRSGLFYELMRVCREVGPRFILLENVAGLLIYPGAHRVFGELASMGYDAGWKIISASDAGAPHQRKRIWIVAKSQYTNPDKFGSYRKEINERGGDERGTKFQYGEKRKSRQIRKNVADSAELRDNGEKVKPGIGEKKQGQSRGGGSEETLADSSGKRRGRRSGLEARGGISKGEPERQNKRNESRGEFEMGCPESSISRWDWKNLWAFEPDVGRVVDGVASRVDRLKCCGNGVVPQQSIPAWEEIKRLA